MDNEQLKRSDQIRTLESCRDFTDTGEASWGFAYPGCGYDLVCMGFVTENKRITKAGRAALWLLEKGEDITTSKAVEEFPIKSTSLREEG